MTSGEVLRHSVSIDEQEVFRLIRKPVELLELQPSRFVGRVASWAEYAERRYGDSINPVMTYVESGPHQSLVDSPRGRGLAIGREILHLPHHLRLHRRCGGKLSAGIGRSHPGLPSRPPCSPEKGGLRRLQVSNVRDPGRPESTPMPATSSSPTPFTSSPSRPSATSSSSTRGIRRNGRET